MARDEHWVPVDPNKNKILEEEALKIFKQPSEANLISVLD